MADIPDKELHCCTKRRKVTGSGNYLKPCSTSSSTTSSSISLAEIIASTEELLTEILLRVPARTLVRFKCVSKHWLALISDPEFCHHHTLRNQNSSISAVFGDRSIDIFSIIFPLDHDRRGSNHGNHNPRPSRCNPLNFVQNQHDLIEIIHSCNGLFLCRPINATSTSRTPYFVLNPTTNQFLTLTIPPAAAATSNGQQIQTHIIGCALAFDPSKSPHYKVICLETTTGHKYCPYYQIQIYSSETRSWRLLNSTFIRQDQTLYEQGGILEWRNSLGRPGFPPHCYEKKWNHRMYRYFKESTGGHLHLIDIYTPCPTKFEVLEMGRDYSGWFVKYHVDLDPLCTAYPCFLSEQFVVLFLAQDENEVESTSLLLHSPGTVISYNLKSKTSKFFELTIDQYLLVGYSNYPYMETLACV
ncbi:hypothetical protein ABKV19_025558 [Rosa sericea]